MSYNFANRWESSNIPNDVKRDKKKSDIFIPEIEKIITDSREYTVDTIIKRLMEKATKSAKDEYLKGNFEFSVADYYEDIKEATDAKLIIKYGTYKVRLGVRVVKFWPRYEKNITIRVRRQSGVKTEYHKLKEGHLDLYFFGWCSEFVEGGLVDWIIYDPNKLCESGLIELAPKREDTQDGGRSYFGRIYMSELDDVILCSKKTIDEVKGDGLTHSIQLF